MMENELRERECPYRVMPVQSAKSARVRKSSAAPTKMESYESAARVQKQCSARETVERERQHFRLCLPERRRDRNRARKCQQ